MLGKHCLKSWSVNQGYIALSSGEAEYYGAVRGASQGIGLKAMLQDLGVTVGVKLHIDASAAIGIAMRRGMGKVRHLELNQLWLQDQVARGRISVAKVEGARNFSDSLTKRCARERIQQTIMCAYHEQVEGRREIMPELS